jgi:ABC-type branched-subunit amino acid transport system substrate-binding protein
VIGHITSSASDAALPEYQQARLAMISPTSTSTHLSGEVFFRTVPSDEITAKKLASYAIKHNIKRIVVFYKKDAYGESLKDAFTILFKRQGGFVQPVELKPDLEPSAGVSRSIFTDAADAAIFFTNTERTDVVVHIAQQAQKTIPNLQKRLKLLGGDGLYAKTTLDKGRADIEGLILAVPWFAKEQNGKPKKFADKASQIWKGQISWQTAASYDATQAFIKAMSISGQPSRETVLKNLKLVSLSPDETSGDGLNFSQSERKQEPVLVQVVGGSRCKEVKPVCFELVK